MLRDAVQPALAAALSRSGRRSTPRDEARLSIPAAGEAEALDAPLASEGRADAIYNRFVIEFEPPGSLRPSLLHSATRHAVTQVKQYLRGISEDQNLPVQRLAGCAFDGRWIVYVAWEGSEWRETRPRQVDRESMRALVEALDSLSTGRGLTAENLDEDFGRASDCARQLVPALWQALGVGTQRTQAMFRQWDHDLGVASGPFSLSDLDAWRTLCHDLQVPSDVEDAPGVLFALQTYFSIVAKLAALIILEGSTGHKLVPSLSEGTDPLAGFAALESGRITEVTGAVNVIEPGILSWYVHEASQDLSDALRDAANLANEYSAEIVEITPLVVRDVLKDLFQRLLPAPIRHRLGEYYTPDWLAQRVVDLAIVEPTPMALDPTTRVVDPACGSGTFLVEVINRQIANAPIDDRERTLELITRNVVGFDVSPLAVQAAKVNYLLALAPLMRSATRPIAIPVFLADSVSPPRRGGLLEGDVYLFESSEGTWALPAPIVDGGHVVAVGNVISTALAEAWERDDVEERLRESLPADCRHETILSGLGDLYAKLQELHRLDRDGMWWQILGNAFAPVLQGTFDLVVGNPPWVSWETLPEGYRRANDAQWLDYGLRPDSATDGRQASAQVRLDLSMLFVARSMDKLLRTDGRLGFVITATVFRSELAGRGFRRRRLTDGPYRFCFIEDLSALTIFEGAVNQTAVLIATRDGATPFPVRVLEWSGVEGRGRAIPQNESLDGVLSRTHRTEMVGEPVSLRDEASPLLVLPEDGLLASRDIRQPSPYAAVVREGINTRGANGIFFLEILEQEESLLRVRNVPSAGRLDVPCITGWLEKGAVRRLLRGEDVRRGSATPNMGLLFFHDERYVSNPMPESVAAAHFPRAHEWASNFEDVLRGRRPFRNFNPSGPNWLGLYSVTAACLAPHKVVFREIADRTIAAPVHSADVIPDHKLHVIPCTTEDEAEWLAEVMNSDVFERIVKAFALGTSMGGSLFRYVGIRDLAHEPRPATDSARVEKALGIPRPQLRLLRDALGSVTRVQDVAAS